jgi:uncharacterized membrane protein
LLLKNPFFFAFAIIVFVALQVWTSYLSFYSFLEGDWLPGFLFLFLVPLLALLMVLYFVWFRRQRMAKPSK